MASIEGWRRNSSSLARAAAISESPRKREIRKKQDGKRQGEDMISSPLPSCTSERTRGGNCTSRGTEPWKWRCDWIGLVYKSTIRLHMDHHRGDSVLVLELTPDERDRGGAFVLLISTPNKVSNIL